MSSSTTNCSLQQKMKRSSKDIETYMQVKKKTKLSSSSSTQLWSLLPEEVIIYDILLKLPVNTLLRLRCVSRYFHSLITNPSFVRKHLDHSTAHQPNLYLLLLHTYSMGYRLYTEAVFKNFNTIDVGNRVDPSLYLHPNVADEMRSPFESAILSSCNGLLFFDRKRKKNGGYIWNPCTKEYKELPLPSITEEEHIVETSSNKIKLPVYSSGFCGFGYDRTNDEYKILYHEIRFGKQVDHPVLGTEFKLYTLGTDTWTCISDNPYGSLFFEEDIHLWKRIGLFVNGALHWIMLPNFYEGCAKIISFDIEKERFLEIQKPRFNEELSAVIGQLQVLQGCLCLCEFLKSKRADVWMLKDYDVKDSWTKLFTIVWPDMRCFRLLRFCENGEFIMRRDRCNLIVCNPVNQKTRLVETLATSFLDAWENEVIYKESLVSLKSGTYSI